jgi:hypothetical protein
MRLPRLRLGASRWRRLRITLVLLVLAGPLIVGELAHVLWWGHLGLGLHTDLVAWGGPESGVGYQVWVANLTPVPLPLRVCFQPSDTGRFFLLRRRVEKWMPASRSWRVVETTAPCGTYPGEQLEWWILWPGTRLGSHQWAPYGLAFRRGDRARITMFGLYDRGDDDWLQIRVRSGEFVIPVDTPHGLLEPDRR